MVVLIGFMGAGKSTVGRLVADELCVPFRDSDAVIEEREGTTIREMFEARGEPYFRDVERRVVTELLGDRDTVLALGGGSPMDPVVAGLLETCFVVHLRVRFERALVRAGHSGTRPLLDEAGVRARYDRRMPVYDALATLCVDTDRLRPRAVAARIVGELGGAARPSEPDGAEPGVAHR